MRRDGTARWANVRKLMRLAREFEASEGPDLGAFLEYLETRANSRDREAEAATRAEGHAGVRVMTVHGAKGLEFDVVAVADLGRNLQLGWSPLRVRPGEEGPEGGELARVGVQLGRLGRPAERLHDYQELTELAAERDAEEEARLAYVAATRAKRRLLLSGTFNPNALNQLKRVPPRFARRTLDHRAQADRAATDPVPARRRSERARGRASAPRATATPAGGCWSRSPSRAREPAPGFSRPGSPTRRRSPPARRNHRCRGPRSLPP